MIEVSTTYNNLMDLNHSLEWRVLNGANTWTSENLITGKLQNTIMEKLSIGNAIASQLDLTLRNITIDTDSPIVLQFRASYEMGEQVSEWFTKGTYYIDTAETSPYSEIAKITAFDALIKAEQVYQRSGKWIPKTARVIATEIAARIGVSLNADVAEYLQILGITLTASPNIGEDGTTMREMLSYIGVLAGGNWKIWHDNTLVLSLPVGTRAYTAQVGDAVRDFDASQVEAISKVRLWIDSETAYLAPGVPLQTEGYEDILTESGEAILVDAGQFPAEWEAIPGQVLDVDLPFYASAEVADRLLRQFSGQTFIPYNAPFAFVRPEYETGDGIAIKDITSIIADQSLDITPLAPSSVRLEKTEVLNNQYPYQPPFERRTNFTIQNLETVVIPEAIDNATTLITGGFGGFIKYKYLADGTPSELLIMDTDSEDTATNIIRLNKNGLGFSTDGGTTYANAWTIDGNLVADFITTGLIKDIEGKNFWNLDTGDFTTKQGHIGGFTIGETSIVSNPQASLFYNSTELTPVALNSYSVFDSENSSMVSMGGGSLVFKRTVDGTEYTSLWLLAGANYNDPSNPSSGITKTGSIQQDEYGRNRIILSYNDATATQTIAVYTGTMAVLGNFNVPSGYSKNKIYDTDDYGHRLLYSYETPTPLYGDVGEGKIGEDGTAYVWLDPIFAETISTSQYQVSLQAYGVGECYVSERAGAYFVVKGEPNLPFGWEIKARQADLDNRRLDRNDLTMNPKITDYGAMAIEHLTEIKEERQVA